jgi:hypothetical protein
MVKQWKGADQPHDGDLSGENHQGHGARTMLLRLQRPCVQLDSLGY